MNKKIFREKLSRGLGSAIIELKTNENIEKFADIVLKACLKYSGYDWQSEGSRGFYLYTAILLFDDHSYFEDRIIKELTLKSKDSDTFDQLVDLLARFAACGSEKSRKKLYFLYDELFLAVSKRKIKNGVWYYKREHLEWLCNRLVSLDGIKGFKKIVNDLCEYYKMHPRRDPFAFDWFYECSADKLGKKRVMKILHDSKIKYEFFELSKQPKVSPIYTLEEAIEDSKLPWSESKKYTYDLFQNNDEESKKKFIDALLLENDLSKKANMLRYFRFAIPFSGEVEDIISYSKSEHIELSSIAFDCLSKISSKAVHDYAIELIHMGKHLEEAISMLEENYQNEDAALLALVVKGVPIKSDSAHGIFSSALSIIKAYKESPIDLLLYMYEHTICSFCREYIVLELNRRRLINNELLEELQYDSNSYIQDFAYKKLKKQQRVTC